MTTPAEATSFHTRLLKCALELDECRAYWEHYSPTHATLSPSELSRLAFNDYWFGVRSLPRIEVLMTNLRARFDAFPPSLAALHGLTDLGPNARRAIAHWHLQLADPLYRAFTGHFLVHRRARADITRPLVQAFVVDLDKDRRWTTPTHVQFASKLLSAAFTAGLVATHRYPRPLTFPRVPDDAIAYLLYLLRHITFEGTLLDNPYFSSVGLDPLSLEHRLRNSSVVTLRRQADLIDLDWAYPDLVTWAQARKAAA